MKSPKLIFIFSIIFLSSSLLVFSTSISKEKEENEANDKLIQKMQTISAKYRDLLYLILDKNNVKPGGKLHYRALLINPFTRKLAIRQESMKVSIQDVKGTKIHSENICTTNGSFSGVFVVPQETKGGQYTIKVSSDWESFIHAEANFTVQAFSNPRVIIEIDFSKPGYSEGDQVQVMAEMKRAEGDIPVGSEVSATLTWNGEVEWEQSTVLEEKEGGKKKFSFKIPENKKGGDAVFTVRVLDKGVAESKSRTVPIVSTEQDIQVKFFPEGGRLVQGVSNTVFFEALSSSNDPLSIEGEIVANKEDGERIARCATRHEGRGKFSFVPVKGVSYFLRVTRPSLSLLIPLPKVEEQGVVLHVDHSIFSHDSLLSASLSNVGAGADSFKVCVFKKEEELSCRKLALQDKQTHAIELTLPSRAQGVLRIIACENIFSNSTQKFWFPVAERLVFRNPKQDVQVTVHCEGKESAITTASQVNCTIKTLDPQSDLPVSSYVSLFVVDDSVTSMEEKRKRRLSLAEKVLLEDEVSHLEDSGAYVEERNMDLLLGTQGWRLLAFSNLTDFLRQFEWKGERMSAYSLSMEEEVLLGQPERAFGRGFQPMLERANVMEGMVAKNFGRVAREKSGVGSILNLMTSFGVFRKESEKVKEGEDVEFHDRENFAETLFSNFLSTDSNGTASFSFTASDSITSFRVFADTILSPSVLSSSEGAHMASNFSTVFSVKNLFYVEPKLPTFVVEGDKLVVPISVFCETDEANSLKMAISTSPQLEVESFSVNSQIGGENKRKRQLCNLTVKNAQEKTANLIVHAAAGKHEDRVKREVKVFERGFPQNSHSSSLLESGEKSTFRVKLPEQFSSLNTSAKVFLKPTSLIFSAIESLISQPYGCFEQTSATMFPMIMAYRLLREKNTQSSLLEKASKFLHEGYKKLEGFEVKGGGFEWFGRSPAHEALTAYGILEVRKFAVEIFLCKLNFFFSLWNLGKCTLEWMSRWWRERGSG